VLQIAALARAPIVIFLPDPVISVERNLDPPKSQKAERYRFSLHPISYLPSPISYLLHLTPISDMPVFP